MASPASARPAWCAPIMHAADAAQCRHTPPSLARVAPRHHAASASGERSSRSPPLSHTPSPGRRRCTGISTTHLARPSRCARQRKMRPAPTGSPTDRAAANAPQTIGASFAMKKIEARAVSRRRGSRPRATRVQLSARGPAGPRSPRHRLPPSASPRHSPTAARATSASGTPRARSGLTRCRASTAAARAQPSSASTSRTEPRSSACRASG